MNTKIISAIAFKLFALYIVVAVLLATPTAIGTFVAMKSWSSEFSNSPIWPSLIITLTIIVTIIAFKVLWRLGNSAIKNISEINEPDHNFSINEFEQSLFMFLGLYFAISAFVDIPSLTASLWLQSQTQDGLNMSDYAWLFGLSIEFFLGLFLLAKPARWLTFIKNLGLSNKTAQ